MCFQFPLTFVLPHFAKICQRAHINDNQSLTALKIEDALKNITMGRTDKSDILNYLRTTEF